MICCEPIGVNSELVPDRGCGPGGHQCLVIWLIMKDRLPSIAPIQQIVEGSRKIELRLACHAFPRTHSLTPMTVSTLVVFVQKVKKSSAAPFSWKKSSAAPFLVFRTVFRTPSRLHPPRLQVLSATVHRVEVAIPIPQIQTNRHLRWDCRTEFAILCHGQSPYSLGLEPVSLFLETLLVLREIGLLIPSAKNRIFMEDLMPLERNLPIMLKYQNELSRYYYN